MGDRSLNIHLYYSIIDQYMYLLTPQWHLSRETTYFVPRIQALKFEGGEEREKDTAPLKWPH